MTPRQYANNRLKPLHNRLDREADRMLNKMATEGLSYAKIESSGTYKQAQLTRMGHPYSRRDPRPPMDPGVINVQSGRFRREWARSRPITWNGKRIVKVYNHSPEAGYLKRSAADDSQSLMIARPIWRLIRKHVKQYLPRYRREFMQRITR